MRGTLTIFYKEFSGIFRGPTFYVIAGLCTVIMSFLFVIFLQEFVEISQNFVARQQLPPYQLNIHFGLFARHLANVNLILVLIVPAFTMRLFAEEKKLRTFDLLLTSPVTSLQITLGKFFAAAAALLALLGISAIYPAMTGLFADISWGMLLLSYLGIFLVGLVYISMNLFCSALTSSALVAYIMAVLLNIFVWYVGLGANQTDSQLARQIYEHISLGTHVTAFVEGIVRTGGLVFIGSVVFLFVFLTERAVESTRWR